LTFASLGLREELLRVLAAESYTTPTPVQKQAIPFIMQGRDVLAAAQTGTGKTAAFALPILQRLMQPRAAGAKRNPRCLIVTPTRELAAQIEESVRTYGSGLPLTATVVFGGVNIRPQIAALQRGVDILVATPGRLLDHVQQRTVDLSRVEILVLDEADRMLDMGFIRDIRRIIMLLPVKRQNLLFSATFTDEIRLLAGGILNDPQSVEVARETLESQLVRQSVMLATMDGKRDLLVHVLFERPGSQALVFTRTKHGADRLARQLQQDGIDAAPIHGNRSQSQRTRALADFKTGGSRVLVATDIAARGLDIEQLPLVVNYELPHVPEDYVHRIGRTGRAGCPGEAVSLVCHEELGDLAAIERLLRKRLERAGSPDAALLAADRDARPSRPASPAPQPLRPRPVGQAAQQPRRLGATRAISGQSPPPNRARQQPAGRPLAAYGSARPTVAPRPAPRPGGTARQPSYGDRSGGRRP